MGSYTLLIVFFFVSIFFSFLCSVWEAALMSISPSYAQILVKEGQTELGHKVEEFKEDIEEPIAAILTLNTIAHTVGAIGVGAQATAIWGETNPFITGAVVPVVMTLAILILSEIIPKTLGAKYWKAWTPFTVKSVSFLLVILAPIIWLSNLITGMIGGEEDNKTSKTEIAVVAEKGEKDGAILATESKIIKNLLRFDSVQAKDIMTPRTVVHAAQEDMLISDFYEKNKELRFSRIPVYTDSKDNINGFIMKDDFLTAMIKNGGKDSLKSIKREISITNETYPITDLFNDMMERRDHIAMVVDEFGGLSGIVTMEDVIETLLGMEIMDEFDSTDDMQVLARKKWEKRAKQLGLIENAKGE